ncbi:MAG TPA: alanine racemase [Solirubrobacteraceae bacterium]|nr:alanine racemase [Solirubrobacteraceae bacterium]
MRAAAVVNLAAIERNCARLAGVGPRLCAVVKADAYGHGAVVCARAAIAGGATWLATATAAEALELRRAGLDGPILVMGALTREEAVLAVGAGADVVAWTHELIDWVAAAGGGRVHVKLDSGMGRLGTRDGDLADRLVERADAAAGIEVVGAMTHFATADELDDGFFDEQLGRFAEWAAGHRDLVVHAANSAGLLRDPAAHFDMARCGVAIYGLDPFGVDPAARGLEPALELRSWVAAVKPCAVGESAGYGRRFVATDPTVLGVVPIGYGDGLRRAQTNNFDVVIAGRRYASVGTVSMDNITVDLGRETSLAPGAEVTLIGRGISAEELAGRLGTINYEITCSLLGRVPRVYHRDGVAEPA